MDSLAAHIVFLYLFQGAGHFVPTDMPVPSYEMWVRFLNNDPF